MHPNDPFDRRPFQDVVDLERALFLHERGVRPDELPLPTEVVLSDGPAAVEYERRGGALWPGVLVVRPATGRPFIVITPSEDYTTARWLEAP